METITKVTATKTTYKREDKQELVIMHTGEHGFDFVYNGKNYWHLGCDNIVSAFKEGAIQVDMERILNSGKSWQEYIS